MKDYLNDINEKFPIRRTKEQKDKFRNYIKESLDELGYQAKIECLEEKHNNIIIGDIKTAKVICTAHYDTPARAILPNIMMPRNKPLFFAYQFLMPIIMLIISYGLAYVVSATFNLEKRIMLLVFLLFYYIFFFLFYMCGSNKHNKNDNTSGVAGVLSTVSNVAKEYKNKVAFILFDNEEKGKKGSKAINKAYPDIFKDKLVLNMDCIGNGNNIIIVGMDGAVNKSEYTLLKETFIPNSLYSVYFFGRKGSECNSDHKSFPCGVGIMACKQNKFVGYYTPYIHTSKDKIANTENIKFISGSLTKFIERI